MIISGIRTLSGVGVRLCKILKLIVLDMYKNASLVFKYFKFFVLEENKSVSVKCVSVLINTIQPGKLVWEKFLFSLPDVLTGELTSLNLHGGADDKE